ncbi:hypothetical protein LCGC14_2526820, partial [marine sediment metagenome]
TGERVWNGSENEGNKEGASASAEGYGNSEQVVGKAIEGIRSEVFIGTKFDEPVVIDPELYGLDKRTFFERKMEPNSVIFELRKVQYQ